MRIKATWWTVILFLLPMTALAQGQKEALVQEVYTKSGMEKQLQQLPLVIQAAVDQALREGHLLEQLPRQVTSAISALAPVAFASENLKEVVLSHLKEKLAAQDIKKVLKWLDSPLGKKCAQLEEAAATPEALTEMRRYAAAIKGSPPKKERLAVLRKLDIASRATETAVEVALSTQVAVALAANYTLPLEQQSSIDTIKQTLKRVRSLVEAEARKETLASLLYTYRNLTETQIRQYIEFLSSPAGSKYTEVYNAALKKALWEGNIRWGKAIGEALEQIKKQNAA